MEIIELTNVNKFFDGNHILKDINLKIDEGDFMTFLGPSGCGKTTTLRVIAGLEDPEAGIIVINGEEAVNGERQIYAPPSKEGLISYFKTMRFGHI